MLRQRSAAGAATTMVGTGGGASCGNAVRVGPSPGDGGGEERTKKPRGIARASWGAPGPQAHPCTHRSPAAPGCEAAFSACGLQNCRETRCRRAPPGCAAAWLVLLCFVSFRFVSFVWRRTWRTSCGLRGLCSRLTRSRAASLSVPGIEPRSSGGEGKRPSRCRSGPWKGLLSTSNGRGKKNFGCCFFSLVAIRFLI